MEQRLEKVLTLLIEDYIHTADPVSSQALVRNHKLDVSSATIRNWFAVLDEEGLLIQPHTSAGRIPSDLAYRWYVERLGKSKISQSEQSFIQSAVSGVDDHSARIKSAAKACVELTKNAALVGTSSSDTYYTGLTELFSQPEFQDWSRVISMSTVLDQLDSQLNSLRKKDFKTPEVMIGEQCPFGNACGAILVTIPNDSLIVMLGPIRMDYKKARNVLNYVSENL
jgi:transcriptional regulator of heat shock response